MAEDKTTQNKKKNRLGKGLDGLIVKKIPAAPVKSEVSAAPAEEGIAVMVPIEKLERNKNSPEGPLMRRASPSFRIPLSA